MDVVGKIYPPACLGIVGAGQLGKMIAQAAKRMGYGVLVLDPKENPPAAQVADGHIKALFSDSEALLKLASQCEVITYEFEHINASALEIVEKRGYRVYPSTETLKKIQDKYQQKCHLQKHGIPLAPFKKIESLEDLMAFYENHPEGMVIKSCLEGYDGKGNWFIHKKEDIGRIYDEISHLPLYAEAFFHYLKEVSVVYANNKKETVIYPVAENEHDQGILIESIVPANIDQALEKKIHHVIEKVAQCFEDQGVFCVELFLGPEGEVVVNEVAPRPHNTGHYSIEACLTSQYEQLVRVITGMPLGSSQLLSQAVMINLLGTEGVEGKYEVKGIESALACAGCFLHLYGKPDTYPRKKMGHLTLLGDNYEEMKEKARQVSKKIIFEKCHEEA